MIRRLPSLSAAPQRHPDCCLSLSTTLLSRILAAATAEGSGCGEYRHQSQLRRDRVVLSIGSGSGLLEACLQRHIDGDGDNDVDSHGNRSAGTGRLVVQGVEVHQQISSDSSAGPQKQQQVALNRYLPEHRRSTVMGTWEVFSELPALLRGAATGHRRKRRRGGPDDGLDRGGRSDDGDNVEEEDEEEEQLARHIEQGHYVGGDDGNDNNNNNNNNNNNYDYGPSPGDTAAGEDSGEEEVDAVVVAALMFVYPRHPSLVRQYVDVVLTSRGDSSSSCCRGGSGCCTEATAVIWLGPRADWVDFEPCFVDDGSSRGGHADDDGEGVDNHHGNDHEGTARESDREGRNDKRRSRISVTVLEGGEAGLLDYEMMSVAYVS
ncbi:hypothetical protein MN608_03235 [Microdochium nivale]|nr:hypothetical protein MN608_03235 [Microdochium nivale]